MTPSIGCACHRSLGRTVAYAYDAIGNRTRTTRADGVAITYDRDALGRVVTISYAGQATDYAFDAVGNRTAMTDTLGVTAYTYDDLDRLTAAAGPNGAVAYTYDLAGNRLSVGDGAGHQTTYAYDAATRMTAVTDWDSRSPPIPTIPPAARPPLPTPTGQAVFAYDDAGRCRAWRTPIPPTASSPRPLIPSTTSATASPWRTSRVPQPTPMMPWTA
jgi:YD repeat-containing protein